MKASTRFKNDIWCVDLAYVVEISKDRTGRRCHLLLQDLFDRTVDAKGKKTKQKKGFQTKGLLF